MFPLGGANKRQEEGYKLERGSNFNKKFGNRGRTNAMNFLYACTCAFFLCSIRSRHLPLWVRSLKMSRPKK